jgi:hypothetical protein
MMTEALPGEWLVGEACDDMQVGMVDRLASDTADIPAQRVAIRTAWVEVSSGTFKQRKRVTPLGLVEIERRRYVAAWDDHAGVLEDGVGAAEVIAAIIAKQWLVIEQVVADAEPAAGLA